MKKFYLLLTSFLLAATVTAQPKQIRAQENTTLTKPVVLAPTKITETGFTANWEKVEGAEAYCLFVYTEHIAQKDETFVVAHEGFERIDIGTIEDPVWSDELYETLDYYTDLPDWSVYAYPTYVRSMVGGVLYTPNLDLRNDNGNFDVTVSVYAEKDDEIFVHAEGSNEEIQSFVIDHKGITTKTLHFTNGVQETFVHFNNKTNNNCYYDEITVTQQLKANDKGYVLVALDSAIPGDQTSYTFPKLRFAPTAKKVFYDLYAAARVYNNPEHPDRYQQIYSEYSDKMEVNLIDKGAAELTENDGTRIYNTENGIGIVLTKDQNVKVYDILGHQMVNRQYAQGSHVIDVNKGIYIVYTGTKAYKIIIK